MYRLIVSLVVGLAFAFLTWIAIGDHPRPTGAGFEALGSMITLLLLPGLFAGFAVSGNIHVANTWVVGIGNLVFYFGFVYIVLGIVEKRKAKRHQDGAHAINADSKRD